VDVIVLALVLPGRPRDNLNTAYLFLQVDAVKLLTTSTAEGQGGDSLFPMFRAEQLRL
jgi:hypothetical protein